ncbi:MAG: signal peptidase I [Lachnospiraceae bacterium]|nr:signal peptidase I [Lachnospiraceae bacterium]
MTEPEAEGQDTTEQEADVTEEPEPDTPETEQPETEAEQPEEPEPEAAEEDKVETEITEGKKKLAKDEKGLKNAQRFLIYLIAFLAVVWILFFKIIGITHMPSDDMEPRVDAGDLLVFYRLDKKAAFQDLIVFEKVIDGKKTLCVGRVMAAPGDKVEITDDNRLVVNGNVIIETAKFYTALQKRGDRVTYPVTLGEDEYFVLADNRSQGMDSRYFGPVSRKEILGTIITLFRRNKL